LFHFFAEDLLFFCAYAERHHISIISQIKEKCKARWFALRFSRNLYTLFIQQKS
jgi:hypothetical protein